MDQQLLAAQLRKPEGAVGVQVGQMMNNGNAVLYKWALEALRLKQEDVVLEIGMGTGFFVKDILSAHSSITYTGVDYSALMVEEAKKQNAILLENERATFHFSEANALPFVNESFSKILTINTIYFWGDAKEELKEVRRVLKPGGLFIIGIRSEQAMQHMPFTDYGFTKYDKVKLQRVLQGAGFTVIECSEREELPITFEEKSIALQSIIATCE